MTAPLLPTADAVWTCAFLWLLLLGLGFRLVRPASARAGLGVAASAAALLFLPVGGLPWWNWVFSYYPNPSLPLLGVLLLRRGSRLFGVTLFQRADWDATWLFGAVAGSMLYLCSVLCGWADLYYWGWEARTAIWTLAGLAVVVLAGGNRFGLLLLGALGAFVVSGLESGNCWDYVVDPVYWLSGLVYVARRSWAGLRAGWARRSEGAVDALPVPVGLEVEVAPVKLARSQ